MVVSIVIGLLVLIILILLFGAAAVKGWIRGAMLLLIGGTLFVTIFVWLASAWGQDIVFVGLGIFAVVLLGLSIWARSYDPKEAAHRERIKRAQEQREQRKREGKNW